MRGVVLACVLAACGNDAGLLLDVHPGDKDVVRVDVLLPGDQPGHYMGLPPAQLATPVNGPKIQGPVYAVADTVSGEVDSSGALRVLLTPGDITEVPAILVIGYDANATPIRYAIVGEPDGSSIPLPHTTSSHIVVNLDPITASPVMNEANATASPRMVRWLGKTYDDASAKCFGVITGSGTARAGVFFGPDGDLDCDMARPECDDTFFLKINTTTTQTGQCATDHADEITADACRVGDPVACIDNVGGCKPLVGPAICVPATVCDRCGGGQDTFDDQCFLDAAADQATLSVACDLPVMDTGNGYAFCSSDPQQQLPLDFGPYLGTGFGLDGVAGFIAPPVLVGSSTLALNGLDAQLAVGAMAGQHALLFDVQTGTAPVIDPALPSTTAVLAVGFADAGADRVLVLPFAASFTDCTHTASCRIVTGVKNGSPYTDPIWHCVGR